MIPQPRIAITLALSTIAASAGSSITNPSNPETLTTSEDPISVRAAIYLWATDLNGEMSIRGNTFPVDVGFDQLVDKIDFAFMGLLEVGHGKWSVATDLFYAKLSSDASTNRVNAESELEQLIGNFVVCYRWIDQDKTRFDTFAGARVNWMETDVDLEFRNGTTWSGSGDQTWIDPIIGMRFQNNFSERFFFRALGDIGGGGISSDITWQAMGAVGYHINERSSVALGYRAIGTDYSHNEIRYDITSHGLLLGYEYKF
jgi:hypothetical protein